MSILRRVHLRHILIQAITLELITFIVSDATELRRSIAFHDLGTTIGDTAVGTGLGRTKSTGVGIRIELSCYSAL